MTDSTRPDVDAKAARVLAPGERMLCYACRPNGPCRLGIRSVAPDGARRVLAHVTCPASHEDRPGVAHGGWTPAVIDEVFGYLGPLNGAQTVTGTLSVDVLRPAPVGRDLHIRAWVDRVEGRRWYVKAEMTLPPAGARLAKASGIFIERRPDHFHSHHLWLAAQEQAPGAPD